PGMITGTVVIPSIAPVITSVSPSKGVRGRTIDVFVVKGSGFTKNARLKLTRNGSADVPITVTYRDANKIKGRFTVPKTVGYWNVQVTQEGYEPGIMADAFHVLYPAPVINAVSPAVGIQDKTISPLSIRGSGFRAGASASFVRSGSTPVPINIAGIAQDKLTGNVILPEEMATGPWKVRVTQPDCMPGSKADAFTVLANVTQKIAITELNLGSEYLKLKNNGGNTVKMTGWKITNGKGRSIKFIEWPRGDGTFFNFKLKPQATVTIYYAKEGVPTETELYFPDGAGMWSQPGDTAYLKNPEGKLVDIFTAT
ncbi:MAG: lamin tail domain-containing protein, partial [Methanomicrobiales archaeon]|nr:lamin tail domain-containing protein [Methanomicrobiales archaeon]